LIYQDFRHGVPLASGFEKVGADGEARITSEAEGLHAVVSATRQRVEPVGVRLSLKVAGDFEITTSYQILHAEQPKEGHGVGFELCLTTETHDNEAITLSRLSRVNEGEVYVGTRITTNDDGTKNHLSHFAEATGNSGQLRIVRTGKKVTCFAAEADMQFRELFTHDFESENLNTIRLAAFPGWAPNAVDIRILDLRVRSLASPAVGQGSRAEGN
jgi:hypothetical protein